VPTLEYPRENGNSFNLLQRFIVTSSYGARRCNTRLQSLAVCTLAKEGTGSPSRQTAEQNRRKERVRLNTAEQKERAGKTKHRKKYAGQCGTAKHTIGCIHNRMGRTQKMCRARGGERLLVENAE
jgi:hypothetical protein